jgi:hypothetical protein
VPWLCLGCALAVPWLCLGEGRQPPRLLEGDFGLIAISSLSFGGHQESRSLLRQKLSEDDWTLVIRARLRQLLRNLSIDCPPTRAADKHETGRKDKRQTLILMEAQKYSGLHNLRRLRHFVVRGAYRSVVQMRSSGGQKSGGLKGMDRSVTRSPASGGRQPVNSSGSSIKAAQHTGEPSTGNLCYIIRCGI